MKGLQFCRVKESEEVEQYRFNSIHPSVEHSEWEAVF